MDNETTQWVVKALRDLAGRMERGEILLQDFDAPSRVIDITPPGTAATERAFTGEHSLNVDYVDADKPTFMRRELDNENR